MQALTGNWQISTLILIRIIKQPFLITLNILNTLQKKISLPKPGTKRGTLRSRWVNTMLRLSPYEKLLRLIINTHQHTTNWGTYIINRERLKRQLRLTVQAGSWIQPAALPAVAWGMCIAILK